MQNSQKNFLRFICLRFRDYKVFGGVNDFWFNRHRTFIAGNGGTGKTIIADALEYLGPPKKGPRVFSMTDQPVSRVAVITKGNCELINKYREFIFLNTESAERLAEYRQESNLKAMVTNQTWEVAENKTLINFQRILSRKSGKINVYRNLNPHLMSAGERICLGYAFVFAFRRALKLDVPVVFDSPYAMLDAELREGVSNFLKAQLCQQILIGHEREFLEEESPHYILVYVENYSHVLG